MQDLINRITQNAGISTDQATKALETIKDFVIEQFPMMAGAVDNLFPAGAADTASDATTNFTSTGLASAVPDPHAPATPEPSFLDKISDFIPGETGQKVEDFAKNAAGKAGDTFDDVKEKLGGMFGGSDKK